MGLLFRVSMFITSFAPLWLSILFIDILSVYDGNPNLITEIVGIVCILLINIASTIYLFAGTRKATDKRGGGFERYSDILVVSARREKAITTEYLLSTVLPLFAFDFTLWRQTVLFLICFATLSFLSLRSGNVYANMFFEFQGYSFFNCAVKVNGTQQEDITILSKINLHATIGHKISIVKIGTVVFINTT